jgi:phosphotransferase family enzyme
VSGLDIARRACVAAGLPPGPISAIHEHASAVFLHVDADVVLRISPPGAGPAVRRGVAVARWLGGRNFPLTLPAENVPVVEVGNRVVSFWRYYPQPGRSTPPAAVLGDLLRRLHSLQAPPVQLPEHEPLAELGRLIGATADLPGNSRSWLRRRRSELREAYRGVNSRLGRGFVHGDAYPGNLLWDGDRAVLGDWDETATAPRELDLVNTYQGVRFGRSNRELAEFGQAYGYDVRAWDGYPVLREIRELHTLGSYLRRSAAGDRAARTELSHRLGTLMAGDTRARWHSVN